MHSICAMENQWPVCEFRRWRKGITNFSFLNCPGKDRDFSSSQMQSLQIQDDLAEARPSSCGLPSASLAPLQLVRWWRINYRSFESKYHILSRENIDIYIPDFLLHQNFKINTSLECTNKICHLHLDFGTLNLFSLNLEPHLLICLINIPSWVNPL